MNDNTEHSQSNIQYIDDDDELIENIHRCYGYLLTQAKATNGALLRMTVDQLILLYNDLYPQRPVELLRLLSIVSDICSMDPNIARPEQSWLALGEPREHPVLQAMLNRFRSGEYFTKDKVQELMPNTSFAQKIKQEWPSESGQPHSALLASTSAPDAKYNNESGSKSSTAIAKPDPLARLMVAAQLSATKPQDPDLLRNVNSIPLLDDPLKIIPRFIICRYFLDKRPCTDYLCGLLHARTMRESRIPLCFRFRANACKLNDGCPLQHVSPVVVRTRRRYIRQLESIGMCLYVPLEQAKTIFDKEYATLAHNRAIPASLVLADFNRFIGDAKSLGRLVSMLPVSLSSASSSLNNSSNNPNNDDDEDKEDREAIAHLNIEEKERILADRRRREERLAVIQPNEQTYLQIREAPSEMGYATLLPAELRGRLQLLLPVESDTRADHLLRLYEHAYHHRLSPTTFTPSKDPHFFLLWLRARGLLVKRDGTVLITKERDAPGAYRAERRILALDALTDTPLPSKAWRYLRHEEMTLR
ncbi:hypothetical protein BDF22DRAFT_735397 [Syncephalis plumigaleata]|nr:hypothetical protein BDF22DRAFT_735397 [Syncephalis plumigaleata]